MIRLWRGGRAEAVAMLTRKNGSEHLLDRTQPRSKVLYKTQSQHGAEAGS